MLQPLDSQARLTRRGFLASAGVTIAAACGKGSPTAPSGGRAMPSGGNGRLTSRPQADRTTLIGGRPLGLATGRDGTLYVPPGSTPDQRLPLGVFLHGGGANAYDLEWPFTLAERVGLALLAPDSRSLTWDAVTGAFGPDVAFIDRALAVAFSVCAIDPGRISILGLSDGGTYSLNLGLVNGDLFGKVVGFSPGFVRDDAHVGRPPVFISHGTQDTVLPIHMASHVIVPKLRAEGYDVTFREFNGGHVVPDEIALEAFQWVA